MNKRIHLILLPFLALLLSINSGSGGYVPVKHTELTASGLHTTLPRGGYSYRLNKESRKNERNAIRIKAWDNVAAIFLPPVWTQTPKIFFCVEVAGEYRKVYVPVRTCCSYSLRGPPTC